MKALFLAGGLGTRLKPLTDKLPKPMVPIMGKPLLERNLIRLKNHGVNEVVLSTCYKPQHIEGCLGDGSRLGLKLHYVCEDLPLGTGGAIKNTEGHFDDTFFIFNSDIVSDIDFQEMLRFHKSQKAHVTIAVTQVDNPSMYGVIEQDEKGYAVSFVEKPNPHEVTSRSINAGVYLFEPEVLQEIPAGQAVSVERYVFPRLLQKGYRIAVYQGCDYWIDIGTPKKYLQVHKDILAGRCPLDEADFAPQGVFKGRNVKIHSTASLIGPVYIGDHVEIGAYASIGPNTVIGAHSSVGVGSKIVGSVVWDHVVINRGARLYNTIVASNCHVQPDTEYFDTVCTEEFRQPMAI